MIYLINNNLDALYYPSVLLNLGYKITGIKVMCTLSEYESKLIAYASQYDDIEGEKTLVRSFDEFVTSDGISYGFNMYSENRFFRSISIRMNRPVSYPSGNSKDTVTLLDKLARLGVKEFIHYIIDNKISYYYVPENLGHLSWYNDPIENLFKSLGLQRIIKCEFIKKDLLEIDKHEDIYLETL